MDIGGPIGGAGAGGGAGGMAAFGDHQGIDLMSWYTSMPGTSDRQPYICLLVFIVSCSPVLSAESYGPSLLNFYLLVSFDL